MANRAEQKYLSELTPMNHEEEINKVIEEFENHFYFARIDINKINTFLRTTCKRMHQAGFLSAIEKALGVLDRYDFVVKYSEGGRAIVDFDYMLTQKDELRTLLTQLQDQQRNN